MKKTLIEERTLNLQGKEKKKNNGDEWVSFIIEPRDFIEQITSMTFLFGYAAPVILLTIAFTLVLKFTAIDPSEIFATYVWAVLVLSSVWATFKFFDKLSIRNRLGSGLGNNNDYWNET